MPEEEKTFFVASALAQHTHVQYKYIKQLVRFCNT